MLPICPMPHPSPPPLSYEDACRAASDVAGREAILAAIRAESGLVDAAAARLSVSRRTLYREIARLGIGAQVAAVRAEIGVRVPSGFAAE